MCSPCCFLFRDVRCSNRDSNQTKSNRRCHRGIHHRFRRRWHNPLESHRYRLHRPITIIARAVVISFIVSSPSLQWHFGSICVLSNQRPATLCNAVASLLAICSKRCLSRGSSRTNFPWQQELSYSRMLPRAVVPYILRSTGLLIALSSRQEYLRELRPCKQQRKRSLIRLRHGAWKKGPLTVSGACQITLPCISIIRGGSMLAHVGLHNLARRIRKEGWNDHELVTPTAFDKIHGGRQATRRVNYCHH